MTLGEVTPRTNPICYTEQNEDFPTHTFARGVLPPTCGYTNGYFRCCYFTQVYNHCTHMWATVWSFHMCKHCVIIQIEE